MTNSVKGDPSGRGLLPEEIRRIASAAQAACSLAFLTKEGGVSYGAAVLTRGGRIFQSGQYSSFNHSTNVHAECGALLTATMQGYPDVIALALASTTPGEIARPCGVCRQVMIEHAQRTRRDFQVVMCSSGSDVDILRVSQLLPHAWSSHHAPAGTTGVSGFREGSVTSETELLPRRCRTGDHVLFGNKRYLGMVWEPTFDSSERIWIKVKYHLSGRKWMKWPHAFSQPFAYSRMLEKHGLMKPGSPLGFLVLLAKDEIDVVLPACSPTELPLPAVLSDFIQEAGFSLDQVRITGSRSHGLAQKDSDWDIMVEASPDLIPPFRRYAADALRSGLASLPASSGTWKQLDRLFPGGQEGLIRERRFLETLVVRGVPAALILIPPTAARYGPLFGTSVPDVRRLAVSGRVIHAEGAPWKAAQFQLESEETTFQIISYCKTANLVREGDQLSLCGWHDLQGPEETPRLIQFSMERDRIRWLDTGRDA